MYILLDKTKTYYSQGGGYKYVPETQECEEKELHLSKEFSWVLNENIHPIIEEKNGILMSVAILEDMTERYGISEEGKTAEELLDLVNEAITNEMAEAKAKAEEEASTPSTDERIAAALEYQVMTSLEDVAE